MTSALLFDPDGRQLPPAGLHSAYSPVAETSDAVRSSDGALAQLMRDQLLYPLFQPIASMHDGGVYAHEALIRGPRGTSMQGADALLRAAREEGLLFDFELHCAVTAWQRWALLGQGGRLFVNISADALVEALRRHRLEVHLQYIGRLGLLPRMLVLELTEHERVTDMNALVEAAKLVHAAGISLALDDFGDGRSSLRLWSQLRPDIVKIDKYFTRNVSDDADKVLTLRALMQIADTFGTSLVAEGIETQDDARVIRDLGMRYGQGYLLGRPAEQPRSSVEPEALEVLAGKRVAVFPEQNRPTLTMQRRSLTVIDAPTVNRDVTNMGVESLFLAHLQLHAVAVVDEERPVAIINRQAFMNHYATPYFKEIRCTGRQRHRDGGPARRAAFLPLYDGERRRGRGPRRPLQAPGAGGQRGCAGQTGSQALGPRPARARAGLRGPP